MKTDAEKDGMMEARDPGGVLGRVLDELDVSKPYVAATRTSRPVLDDQWRSLVETNRGHGPPLFFASIEEQAT